MKPYKITFSILFIFITLISCVSQGNKTIDKYCGIELSNNEYNNILQKAEKQRDEIYDADSLWSIYDQVNDTLRKVMPDDIVFEIFLNTLDKGHFSIDVIVPKDEVYFEKIACKFMNTKFKGDIPPKRILCLYSYTNLDGSGETPLVFAIKNKEN